MEKKLWDRDSTQGEAGDGAGQGFWEKFPPPEGMPELREGLGSTPGMLVGMAGVGLDAPWGPFQLRMFPGAVGLQLDLLSNEVAIQFPLI